MASTRHRFTLAVMAFVLLAFGFLLAAWPAHRLAERGLLPASAMRPYQVVAVALAGTPPGDVFVWWLDRCADGGF